MNRTARHKIHTAYAESEKAREARPVNTALAAEVASALGVDVGEVLRFMTGSR